MNLFLTGGSGFVGQRLLGQLSKDTFARVTCLARGELSLPEGLAGADNVHVLRGDLSDAGTLAEAMDADTVVVHLAALTGNAAPDAYHRVNTEGTRTLAEAAKSAGARGFIYVSTIAVAFDDTRGYHYAHSKQAAEELVSASGLPFTIVRPTIVLGEGSPVGEKLTGLAGRSPLLIPGPGRARIQPIDASDLASALLELAKAGACTGETIDLGGPEALSMEAFLRRAHAQQAGQPAGLTLHLPVQLALPILRLLERLVGSLLPVSAGQFASFFNDGVARDNAVLARLRPSMKGVDAMIRELVGGTSSDGSGPSGGGSSDGR